MLLEGQVTLKEDPGQAASEGELVFVPPGADARLCGGASALWLEIEAPIAAGIERSPATSRTIPIDQAKFEGSGFAYQSLVDKSSGAETMRMNVLQVQPGAGSPDFHIHAFAQIYVIQDGEMTLDVGTARRVATAGSLVILPAGMVHRNFNASASIERHVSLLVPEPAEGAIFDYAVTIHDREAALLEEVPAGL